jgi:hypothetical protein
MMDFDLQNFVYTFFSFVLEQFGVWERNCGKSPIVHVGDLNNVLNVASFFF